MKLWRILRFQFGDRDAILKVAQSRSSLLTGIILVLLTGIPRNYDQTYFLESPFWLIGPLVFSFFSGTFLFWFLYHGFIRRHLQDPKSVSKGQWRSFMSLFWMTAPVAWLYAIPVERMFDSYRAAQANLTLLAVVSVWRVLLMSRIISVVQQMKFLRALGWVLVPACLEVLLVVFFGTNPSRRILEAMGGMRHSPEERLILSALGNVATGAVVLLLTVLVVLAFLRFHKTVQPFPERVSNGIPNVSLLFLTTLWIALAVPSQFEQYRFVTHKKLIEAKNFRESLEYLSRFTPADFPASRRIEPNPYEYRVWEELPGVMAHLQPLHPKWIRDLYLGYSETLFSHYHLNLDLPGLVQILEALERLPEGKGWMDKNRSVLPDVRRAMENDLSRKSDDANIQEAARLTNALHKLGASLDESEGGAHQRNTR